MGKEAYVLEGMKKGMNFLLFAKIEGEWVKLAGQQGATMNMSAESLDRTCKDSGMWREKTTSFKEWSFDTDGIIVFGNKAYEYLVECFIKSRPVHIAMSHTSREETDEEQYANFLRGKATISEFNHEFGYEDNATYSMTLEGSSQPIFFAKDDVPEVKPAEKPEEDTHKEEKEVLPTK